MIGGHELLAWSLSLFVVSLLIVFFYAVFSKISSEEKEAESPLARFLNEHSATKEISKKELEETRKDHKKLKQ